VGQKVRSQGPIWLIFSLLLIALYLTIYSVDQTEVAVAFQFGEPQGEVLKPGFHIKVPLVHRIVFFDTRLQHYNSPRVEILTADKKSLLVGVYAQWRIVEPIQYHVSVGEKEAAARRLEDVVMGQLRTEFSRYAMTDLLAKLQDDLAAELTEKVDKVAGLYGLTVLDLRWKDIFLPPENEGAVFARMRSERESQASKYLAEGRRRALEIEAAAEKEKAVLLAEAHRKAEEIRGRADREAARIYAEAFSKDPDFYRFTRTLNLYRKTIDDRATLFLSRDDEIMSLVQSSKDAPLNQENKDVTAR